jgi:hypothetical protein
MAPSKPTAAPLIGTDSILMRNTEFILAVAAGRAQHHRDLVKMLLDYRTTTHLRVPTKPFSESGEDHLKHPHRMVGDGLTNPGETAEVRHARRICLHYLLSDSHFWRCPAVRGTAGPAFNLAGYIKRVSGSVHRW